MKHFEIVEFQIPKPRLKKELNLKDLTELKQKGFKIKRNYLLDTFGTSAMGLLVRRGITISKGEFKKDYQVLFNSRNYGRITSKKVWYNERYLPKYDYYMTLVNEWQEKNLEPLFD